MFIKHRIPKPVAVLTSVLILLLLAACGPAGISREEADLIQADIEAVSSRLSDVESQLNQLDEAGVEDEAILQEILADINDIQAQLSAVLAELEPPEDELDDLGADPGF